MKTIRNKLLAVIIFAAFFASCELFDMFEQDDKNFEDYTLSFYTVVYNANNGSGEIYESSLIYGQNSSLDSNAFFREGYTITGWAETPEGTVRYTNGQSVYNLTGKNGRITLYAVWRANAYTVSYNANQGIGNMQNSRFTYDEPQNLPVNTFTREGKTFKGWARSPGGAVEYTDGESVINLSAMEGATITLYAVWRGGFYTVVYDANGGSGTMEDSVFVNGEPNILPPNAFTRKGHAFAGWRNASNDYDLYNDEGTIQIDTDEDTVTLYVEWYILLESAYYVVYNAGVDEATGNMERSLHIIDEEKNLSPNAFTRWGYVFEGWSTSSHYMSEVEYTDEESVINLLNFGYYSEINLYAKWRINYYTVLYHPNGGSDTMLQNRLICDEPQNLRANTFTRAGYTFEGWSTSISGEVEYADGESVKDLTEVGGTKSLYAVWSENAYKVVFNANGGEGEMADSAFLIDVSKDLPANAFTRVGYTFIGWAASASGAVAYTDKQSVKNLATTIGETVKLYAVWRINTYTVFYSNNGGNGTMTSTAFTYGTPQSLRANTFTRENYVFTGWAGSPDGAVEYTDGQSVINLTALANVSVNLYAVWKAADYTIIYSSNGGSGNMNPSFHLFDVPQNLRTNTFTRTGHTFTGWAASASGAAEYANGQSINLAAGGTITLYAVWKLNTYTVSYSANGSGTAGTMESSAFTYGETQSLRENTFTRSFSTFAGWATSASGTAVYNDGQAVSNLTITDGVTVILYAVWNAVPIEDNWSLADKLGWLEIYAQSNVSYEFKVTADEDLEPTTLSYNGKTNIKITLKSDQRRFIGLSSNGALFTVENGVTLNLLPYVALRGKAGNNNSVVRVNRGGTLNMSTYSLITGNTASAYGGGVYVAAGGTFNMNSGEISGNTASSGGGGVFVASGGTFNMTGGEIKSNTSPSYGGGVNNSGTFTMSGGKISGNTATSGGGGVLFGGGSFTMNGGEISGNTATSGGGVYMSSGTFKLEGGKISGNGNNTPSTSGGGVYMSNGTFTMSGGEISDNTASSGGGGVYMNGGTFTMQYNTKGKISGNTAPYGGGVACIRGTFTMSGGEISASNTASAYGGGVYVQYGTFEKTSSTILYTNYGTISGEVRNSSGGLITNRGHAVYTVSTSSILGNGRRMEGTAGPGVALSWDYNNGSPKSSGGWTAWTL